MPFLAPRRPKAAIDGAGQLSVSTRDMAADLLAPTDRPAAERRRRLLTLANLLSDLRALPSTGANSLRCWMS